MVCEQLFGDFGDTCIKCLWNVYFLLDTLVTMSFGVQGERFPCFVCGMILLCPGMGGETVPIPCKNRWLVFGSAGMNPTPLKRMIS